MMRPSLSLALCVAVCAGAAPTAHADQAADVEALYRALHLSETIAIMREEGLAYGAELADDMLPGGNTPLWGDLVSRIYDTTKMETVVRADFTDAIGQTDVTPLLAFFESDAGQKATRLELEARRAFLDQDAEDAARAGFLKAEADKSPRVDLIGDYIDTNDLVDFNVSGALNANLMFFRGLVEGGALDMSEEDILSDVWGQEAETRADTREWLYAYLMMAYQPLSDQELVRYIDLFKTPAGRVLNQALFAGFDRMYNDISVSLGVVTASQMQGEEL